MIWLGVWDEDVELWDGCACWNSCLCRREFLILNFRRCLINAIWKIFDSKIIFRMENCYDFGNFNLWRWKSVDRSFDVSWFIFGIIFGISSIWIRGDGDRLRWINWLMIDELNFVLIHDNIFAQFSDNVLHEYSWIKKLLIQGLFLIKNWRGISFKEFY